MIKMKKLLPLAVLAPALTFGFAPTASAASAGDGQVGTDRVCEGIWTCDNTDAGVHCLPYIRC
ncbi:hypothetical protein [uncultured Pseudokineococcus sp.]|uniref:hypothetical protein n=1 Tax=uncultured Pseudokineococcus sp. TaxID=1642928 RepID=UPI00262A9CE4|nr:hypothetical protein [uncultured Pseudokineococcus sp.]